MEGKAEEEEEPLLGLGESDGLEAEAAEGGESAEEADAEGEFPGAVEALILFGEGPPEADEEGADGIDKERAEGEVFPGRGKRQPMLGPVVKREACEASDRATDCNS